MPTGVIVDAASVLIGGLLGAVGGHLLSDDFKRDLNLIFGVSSMGMGIMAIVPMKNMPAVIFALILGTVLGLGCHLGRLFNKGAMMMQAPISKHFPTEKLGLTHDEFVTQLGGVVTYDHASGEKTVVKFYSHNGRRHKDILLAQLLAKEVKASLPGNLCVMAGVNLDGITREQIEASAPMTRYLARQVLAWVKGQAGKFKNPAYTTHLKH